MKKASPPPHAALSRSVDSAGMTTLLTPTTLPAPQVTGSGDLGLLVGPTAGDILRTAFAASGGTVLSWRAGQVDHQPGGRSTVAYSARVAQPDGHVTDERVGACTGTPPPGTLTLDDGEHQVSVWRFPHDPDLPGLSAACNATAVATVMADLGLGDGPVTLKVRAYRPRRRAVIEAIGGRNRLFVKVVRPHRVAALHERHRTLLAAGVPAPQSLGWNSDGLIVMEALGGRTLRQALRVGRQTSIASLPPGEAITELLDRLPPAPTNSRTRQSWLDRVPHYAAVVAAVLPETTERTRRLAEAISAEAGTGPQVPTHGDFYETQLMIERSRISGLLDIDTAGVGDRLDDLGCLLGHLSVLAQLDRPRAGAINRLGARYLASFEREVDPTDLRYRAAAVVVSLATGPHRVQQHHWQAATLARLDLAEHWLDSARDTRNRRRR